VNTATLHHHIEALYNQRLADGRYENVEYLVHGSQKTRHYAMNSAFEFFAESTEAYWGKNDYYPFNREELLSYDPELHSLIEKAWYKQI